MPDWGLTEVERRSEPWGFPEDVLMPGKVFTDPVHGDIHLTRLEVAVIDSPPYQRLRRVRQLGQTHLVYPGATHTRFSHGLGTLRVAQLLLDQVHNQRLGLHRTDDLIEQWHHAPGVDPTKSWAEATVLARLGALLHDLCHVPAGHTVEDDLHTVTAHDENRDRFERLWGDVAAFVRVRLVRECGKEAAATVRRQLLQPSSDLYTQLEPLIISKAKAVLKPEEMTYPFCADLVGNTICADLLDYLERDHLFTGLPESLGRRFISAFFVVPAERGAYSKRLALNIMRAEHERTDIVSELLKALRYRYELTERVLVHPAKLAADAMLGEAIERWTWAEWWAAAVEAGVLDEAQVDGRFDPNKIPDYRATEEHEFEHRDEDAPLTAKIKDEVDRQLSTLGDEALLDRLETLNREAYPEAVEPLLRETSELAAVLRDRNLFRAAARIGPRQVSAEQLWKSYGQPRERARLERGAQRYAGLSNTPQLILWIPPPTMRLKLAEVLVHHGGGISPFVAYERAGARRGSEIYDDHERLWAAYVFVDRAVDARRAERAVAWLAKEMGVRWERHAHLGPRPEEWPLRLAIAKVRKISRTSRVDSLMQDHRAALEQIAARGGETFEGLCEQVNSVLSKRARPAERPPGTRGASDPD